MEREDYLRSQAEHYRRLAADHMAEIERLHPEAAMLARAYARAHSMDQMYLSMAEQRERWVGR